MRNGYEALGNPLARVLVGVEDLDRNLASGANFGSPDQPQPVVGPKVGGRGGARHGWHRLGEGELEVAKIAPGPGELAEEPSVSGGSCHAAREA